MRTNVNSYQLEKWLFVSRVSGKGDLQTNMWVLIKAFNRWTLNNNNLYQWICMVIYLCFKMRNLRLTKSFWIRELREKKCKIFRKKCKVCRKAQDWQKKCKIYRKGAKPKTVFHFSYLIILYTNINLHKCAEDIVNTRIITKAQYNRWQMYVEYKNKASKI